MREIKENTRMRHFKGKEYTFLCKGWHTETGEPYAIYRAEYDDFKVYIRPYDMFVSEVDREKYPNVEQKYRFEEIR